MPFAAPTFAMSIESSVGAKPSVIEAEVGPVVLDSNITSPACNGDPDCQGRGPSADGPTLIFCFQPAIVSAYVYLNAAWLRFFAARDGQFQNTVFQVRFNL